MHNPTRPAALALLALLLAPVNADASYRELCSSSPRACDYTGPDAPMLAANVCHGSTGTWLMGSECPSGTWPYYVKHGEVVDPLTNLIAAYIPLDDACPKLCVDGPPPPDAEPYPMCCTGNTSGGDSTCVSGVHGCTGTVWYCHDGVSNQDGTVTCFNAQEF